MAVIASAGGFIFPESLTHGQSRRKVAVVVGTRPEVIKMAPVMQALGQHPEIDVELCVVQQQEGILDRAIAEWRLQVDVRLQLDSSDRSLGATLAGVIGAVGSHLARSRPDFLLVQGDTTTAIGAGLAAFYARVPVGHVEAGLRSGWCDNPFPEEMNRRLLDTLATVYYAPTARARDALIAEGHARESVVLVGNTVVDALLQMRGRIGRSPEIPASTLRTILVTTHRRESFGAGVRSICLALRTLVRTRSDIEVVYVLHPNPLAQGPVVDVLGGEPRVRLISPQSYEEFVALLDRCYVVLTDSGGVQEEAPYLGKPVLVTRDVTERPEAVQLGLARIVGCHQDIIVGAVTELLDDPVQYAAMTVRASPFGDGNAAQRVVQDLHGRLGAFEGVAGLAAFAVTASP